MLKKTLAMKELPENSDVSDVAGGCKLAWHDGRDLINTYGIKHLSSSSLKRYDDVLDFVAMKERASIHCKSLLQLSKFLLFIFHCYTANKSNMVSELAGEEAMPPQLPAPARRLLKIAELRNRRWRLIHSGSLLRRGVTSEISFQLRRSFYTAVRILKRRNGHGAAVRGGDGFKALKQDSLFNSSRMLIHLLFKAFNYTSWNRSVKNLSKMLVNLFVGSNQSSRSRFAKRKSAELINPSSMAIVVPSSLVLEKWRSWSRSMKISSRVLVNPLFIAFDCRSWSRSVEIDDNSSEEIEDKAENLGDGQELAAVNKIRRRRFVFDDEEEQEEQKDEIDVVVAGTSTHIQKLRSAQMKLDLDVVSSGFVLSGASRASLGFSFTGFSKAFSENDQPEDSEKTSFNSAVQQHSSQQPWFSRQNSGGSKSLCSDLEVDHIDIQILMLVWKMQAEKQKVKRPSNFVEFYAYLFPYYLNDQEPKNIVMESICVLLDFVEGSVAREIGVADLDGLDAINAHAVNIPLYAVLDIGLDLDVFNEGQPIGVEGLDLEVQEIMDILVYYLQGGQVVSNDIFQFDMLLYYLLCFLSLELMVQTVLVLHSFSTDLNLEQSFSIHAGIAYTRWAIHGETAPSNSHPQISGVGNDFLVVHNGVIINYEALKETPI
nr:glutamine--fructose-6-phosphate aminotransferase [isomerizing] 2 [Ipomoea batatas]